MDSHNIPLDLDSRWEWVKYQLRIRGTSIADLAREAGLNESAFRNAKRRAYPRVERDIANALNMLPGQIWPERWNADGSPLRLRPNRAESNSSATAKDTGESPEGNNNTAHRDGQPDRGRDNA
ncbi:MULTISPECIES: helix-turn-helix domain-containing protein [Pseudomonas]|uniref:helix-turn-helix domain-containing protein n=1 Tax=Pseudomonas TaxID=286 RepID=UPI001C24F8A3|nr:MULTISPECIES: helix-turn-helix domain-containing protein [Pseudomonas]